MFVLNILCWMFVEDICSERFCSTFVNACGRSLCWTLMKIVENISGGRFWGHVWRTIVAIYRYSIRHIGSSSDRRCQVNVDGAQRRHDGQVKEGEASQLDLKWRPNRKRGHGEQCIQCLIDPTPFSVQYVPHWTETVLSVCVGWDRHGGG